jgi:hypothetical protein
MQRRKLASVAPFDTHSGTPAKGTIMTLLYLFLALSIFCTGCAAQTTALPKEAPADVSFDYYQGGAMSRSYRKFDIENGMLTFEELRNRQEPKIAWTAKVTTAEIADLYKAFRTNGFDTIQNDERDAIVHDAGSESISISLGIGKTYRVTYGHNSPLSGRNLERYRAVKKALDALLARHGSSKKPPDDDPLTGTWRAAGDHGNGHTWYLQWKFADGEFEMQGYPPILQKGKYQIAGSSDGKFSLVLFDQSGNFGAEERTVEVAFGPDGTLKIDQMAGFRKIKD